MYTRSHPLTLTFLDVPKPNVHISNDLLEWAERSFNSYIADAANKDIEINMNQSIYEIPLDLKDLYSEDLVITDLDPDNNSTHPLMLDDSDPFLSDTAELSNSDLFPDLF